MPLAGPTALVWGCSEMGFGGREGPATVPLLAWGLHSPRVLSSAGGTREPALESPQALRFDFLPLQVFASPTRRTVPPRRLIINAGYL